MSEIFFFREYSSKRKTALDRERGTRASYFFAMLKVIIWLFVRDGIFLQDFIVSLVLRFEIIIPILVRLLSSCIFLPFLCKTQILKTKRIVVC